MQRTPITYYGGKQQLVSTILPMIPPHRVYCEPYFGGGAIFFAKGKSFCEVVNDIDDRIITFYDVCQDEGKFLRLQQKIQNTPNPAFLKGLQENVVNLVEKEK